MDVVYTNHYCLIQTTKNQKASVIFLKMKIINYGQKIQLL